MENTMVTVPVELGAVRRIEAIIAAAIATGDYDYPGALDVNKVIRWADELACDLGTADQWADAISANTGQRGSLVLLEVEASVLAELDGALAAAQAVVTYTPTYGSAIGWMLDVAADVEGPGSLLATQSAE